MRKIYFLRFNLVNLKKLTIYALTKLIFKLTLPNAEVWNWGIFVQFFSILYSTLLHLPDPPDAIVLGDARDRTQDCCVVGNSNQTGLSTEVGTSWPKPLVQFGIKTFCWCADPDQAFFGATKWGKKCHGSGPLLVSASKNLHLIVDSQK